MPRMIIRYAAAAVAAFLPPLGPPSFLSPLLLSFRSPHPASRFDRRRWKRIRREDDGRTAAAAGFLCISLTDALRHASFASFCFACHARSDLLQRNRKKTDDAETNTGNEYCVGLRHCACHWKFR